MKYLRYYFRLCYARFCYDLTKGHNLPLAIVGSACFFFTHILAYSLVLSKFTFSNWSSQELWVLFYIFELYLYACFQIFFRGLLHSRQDIALGKFDYLSIKPGNIMFLALIREGSLNNLVNVILSISFLIFSIIAAQLQTSLIQMFLFLLTFSISLMQFHFISGSLITLNFKYGQVGNTATLFFKFNEVWKYPAESFRSNMAATLLVYPFALFTSLPAYFLLGKPVPISTCIIFFSFTIFLYIIYRLSWAKALRLYSSASS